MMKPEVGHLDLLFLMVSSYVNFYTKLVKNTFLTITTRKPIR